MVESIYRNPSRWKAVINTNDVRHGTAGCLLSFVLFAPLFVKSLGMGVTLMIVCIYSLLIVPAATNYYSPAKLLIKSVKLISSVILLLSNSSRNLDCERFQQHFTRRLFESFYSFVSLIFLFVQMLVITPLQCINCCVLPSFHIYFTAAKGLRVAVNQALFFFMCERQFNDSGRRFTYLYLLLLFTIISYIIRALINRPWSNFQYDDVENNLVTLSSRMYTNRVARGISLVFLLFMFSEKVKIEELNFYFLALTSSYFLFTEIEFKETSLLVESIKRLHIELFDNEEQFWMPFLSKTIPVLLTSIGLVMCICSEIAYIWFISTDLKSHTKINSVENHGYVASTPSICDWIFNSSLFASILYCNLIVPMDLLRKEYDTWSRANGGLTSASKKDLELHQDCSICFETLTNSTARKTICKHLFHMKCINQWLEIRKWCPLCKTKLMESI